MIPNHEAFLGAIREKKMIRVAFYSQPDSGTVDRECAPLDYGPGPGGKDPRNRYWIWDHAVAADLNPLGLLPDQIVSVNVLGSDFDPARLALGDRTWSVPRPWGMPPPSAGQPNTTAAKR